MTKIEKQLKAIVEWLNLPWVEKAGRCPFRDEGVNIGVYCRANRHICLRHFGAIKFYNENASDLMYCPCDLAGSDTIEEFALQLIEMAPQLIGRYKSL